MLAWHFEAWLASLELSDTNNTRHIGIITQPDVTHTYTFWMSTVVSFQLLFLKPRRKISGLLHSLLSLIKARGSAWFSFCLITGNWSCTRKKFSQVAYSNPGRGAQWGCGFSILGNVWNLSRQGSEEPWSKLVLLWADSWTKWTPQSFPT